MDAKTQKKIKPYTTIELDQLKLPWEEDKRRKMTEEQIAEAKDLYKKGYTQKEVAEKLGVSRTTIGYVVSETAKQRLLEYRKEHPLKKRPKEEQSVYIRNLRERKKKIFHIDSEEFKGETK